jgi:hypothetical protein
MQFGQPSSEAEERAKHLSAIQSLCEQHHLPPATVAEIYERELERFLEGALIRDYLPIFVSRRVGEMLRAMGPLPPAGGAADRSIQ